MRALLTKHSLLTPRRLHALHVPCLRHAYTTTTTAARLPHFLQISDEVRSALAESRPVVALESAVYTHGFPVPDNLALSHAMEAAVRDAGAVPATICVLRGKARVGLSKAEIEEMTSAAGKEGTVKVSRRDLGFVTGLPFINPQRSFVGGTTIAGTSLLAHMAGIKVFATGGLGGVHRGVSSTWDVSADLTELGRTPIAVISSYAKAFLDLEKTLEYLETQGVYVATFNKSGMMPAFYSAESTIKAPSVLKGAEEAAALGSREEERGMLIEIDASHALGLQSGQLFTNPVPLSHEIPHEAITDIIAAAVQKARDDGVSGKDVTPYILSDILQRTGGKSIECNRALLVNNASMGAKVAVELAKLEGGGRNQAASGFMPATPSPPVATPPAPAASPIAITTPKQPQPTPTHPDPEVIVIGGLALDLSCDFTPPPSSSPSPSSSSPTTTSTTPVLHTSNPSSISETLGGVATNVSHALHLCGTPTRLVSSVGTDLAGTWALSQLTARGMDTSGITTSATHPTARYVATNTSTGALFVAAADMRILDTLPAPALPPSARWVIADGNLPPATLAALIATCAEKGARFVFEPTSTAKAARIFTPALPLGAVTAAAPNVHELSAMHAAAEAAGLLDTATAPEWWAALDDLRLGAQFRDRLTHLGAGNGIGARLQAEGVLQKAVQLAPYIHTQYVTMGAEGVVVVHYGGAEGALGRGAVEAEGVEGSRIAVGWFGPGEVLQEGQGGGVVGVNGAGDTFLGVLVAGLVRGWDVPRAVGAAQRGAVMTLRSREAVATGVGAVMGE
ncbi:Indigoidine synthase A like protein-domain-containing protein [Geopyxis carbonaria]|nr:Indigoidine synthase A like protein-domain-containing protein [Geopyxis carbonaria]